MPICLKDASLAKRAIYQESVQPVHSRSDYNMKQAKTTREQNSTTSTSGVEALIRGLSFESSSQLVKTIRDLHGQQGVRVSHSKR